MKRTLWLIEERELARLYSKVPSSRNPGADDEIWIPRQVIKHQSKTPRKPWPECIVEVEDWFAEKVGL